LCTPNGCKRSKELPAGYRLSNFRGREVHKGQFTFALKILLEISAESDKR